MKILDLSQTISSGMKVYQGDPQVKITEHHNHKKDGWKLQKITMGSHTGTHVDAFSHMHQDKKSLDDISLDRFFGPAQVVDINKEWPAKMGLLFIDSINLKQVDKLILCKPNFVGGDISEDLERELLANDIITFTNLVNLDKIPKHITFMFYGLPLKIEAGDGSPVRAIAIL